VKTLVARVISTDVQTIHIAPIFKGHAPNADKDCRSKKMESTVVLTAIRKSGVVRIVTAGWKPKWVGMVASSVVHLGLIATTQNH